MGVIGVANESFSERLRNDGNSTETDSVDTDEETQLLNKAAKAAKEGAQGPDKYPRAVFFILGNEFCERFCYYGMRTILTIYLTEELLYSESKATILFHSFIMLAYFTPLFGALLADSWLGKFRTILYLSVIYALGNIVLSVGSIPNSLNTMTAISLVGLFTIGVGTGGIKPCVSAFGGDQFEPSQESQRQKFFSIFYFAINSGSVLSTIATPILRADVHCFGSNSCYPLAYGVPATLMLVALFLFLIGKPLYKIQPAGGNIFGDVLKCIFHALSRKSKSSEKKKDHWLEYADDKFDKGLIKDIQSLLHVLWIFLPVPVFWALFDQTGSSWTLQATKMDGMLWGYHIKPDQMQVMNALMIIVMIPLFDYLIYPLFSKCRLLKKPLQRMAVGGFLSALAFVLAGFVELRLEASTPMLPEPGTSELTIINNSPCDINITGQKDQLFLPSFQSEVVNVVLMEEELTWAFNPSGCDTSQPITQKFNTSFQFESVMLTLQKGKLQFSKVNDTRTRTSDAEPKFRLFFSTDVEFSPNSSFKLVHENSKELFVATNSNSSTMTSPTSGMTDYFKTANGKYKIYSPINDTSHNSEPIGEVKLNSGGIYVVAVYNSNVTLFTLMNPNSLSIMWQIPAYLVLTAGEIMFSITGLEFSYSQAPKSMKSVVQAAWLLTVAFGNLIVMIIAKLSLFEKKSYELYMFAALMGLDMLIFSVMAYFYKYVSPESMASKEKDSELRGKKNEAYEEETDFNK